MPDFIHCCLKTFFLIVWFHSLLLNIENRSQNVIHCFKNNCLISLILVKIKRKKFDFTHCLNILKNNLLNPLRDIKNYNRLVFFLFLSLQIQILSQRWLRRIESFATSSTCLLRITNRMRCKWIKSEPFCHNTKCFHILLIIISLWLSSSTHAHTSMV